MEYKLPGTDSSKSVDAKTKELREKYGIPLSTRILLFASLTTEGYERKGFKYFESCMEELGKISNPNDYTIVILGPLNVAKKIHNVQVISLGILSDMREVANVYKLSDVTVFSSQADNLPNVIKESMACGTPCVAFAVGGVLDMIKHVENGYLAPFGNSSELAKGITWVFEQDREVLRKTVSDAAAAKHGYANIVGQYLNIYESMLIQNE